MHKTIGRFEIRRELGRGAQSVVYQAWDPQLQRDVAIKTMHFDKAEAGQNAALLAEARTVSNLRHPNVVPIFDAGEADGDPYLVFEYVEGRSLADALKSEGKLPAGRAADIMRQVADALSQAHALGIIHRDLKPTNILLDGRGMPRVMDFGIAMRVTGDAAAQEKGLSGTPAYMAPEYVTRQEISVKNDVFAAGLILLELLTGARVMQGSRVDDILKSVTREPVRIPRGAGIDDRLADIVLRCCAADPAARYPSAAQLKEALEAYLGTGAAAPPPENEGQKKVTLEFLLRRMRHKSDFPALSDSVLTINKLMDAEKGSVSKLSVTILKDYALTNKILRMVNSVSYRQAGGGNISTVSRAVVVLGFDSVRNIAMTVLLFEHLQDKGNARELKEAFLRSNLAGLLARDVGKDLIPGGMEEAFISALFYGLGQLLAQYYFPEEEEAIRNLMQSKRLSSRTASTQVLGVSYDDLGRGIAKTWGFPVSILRSMQHLTPGPVRRPDSHDEMLRLVAGFASEVCEQIATFAPEDRSKVLRALVSRFAVSLQISENQLLATLEESFGELMEFASILRLSIKESTFARQVQVFIGTVEEPVVDLAQAALDVTLASTLLSVAPVYGGEDAAASDYAQSVLTAGIQDISNSLVDDFAVNDILRIILETIYRGMGFQRVVLCLRDARMGAMTGRFGFGPDTADLAKVFRFPLAFEPDVFHLAMQKSADLIVSDIDDPKIAEHIPRWYREGFNAKTFVVFPLAIKNKPMALIYCDKEKAGSIVIPEKELSLLKTLRNQALLAIKQTA